LAIPAIRASGLYLALATLGFGLLVQDMFYQSSLMFGTFGSIAIPRPSLSFVDVNSDKGFYYVTLVVLVLAAGVMTAITRSRLGRLLRATAVSPLAVATNGTSLTRIRVLIFCISAYMAGIAGALLGATLTIGSPDSFPPLLSLTYVAVVVIVAGAAPWYGLVAAAGIVLIPAYWTSANAALGLQVLFGVSAVVVALHPEGLALPRFGRRGVVTNDRGSVVGGNDRDGERIRPATSTELRVDDLGVRFGGLVAVDKLSLVAQAGRITGLIGPNGAGKTTAFNACSGLVRGKVSGELSFNRTRLNDLGPAARARLGLGRTFQQPELCDSLTVRENVAVGAEAGLAGRRIVSQGIGRRHESDLVRRRVDAALAMCDLSDAAAMVVSALPTGQRRFVELARCLAGDYSLLMLDEPSSGLDERETRQLGDVVQRVVRERGIGVLLVEHDVELVRTLCEYVYVLDFGQVIAAGITAEVLAAPEVKAAYLGEDVRTLSPDPVVEAAGH
jgi:ABC-type branched-subunit amino acid transport system ATPase component